MDNKKLILLVITVITLVTIIGCNKDKLENTVDDLSSTVLYKGRTDKYINDTIKKDESEESDEGLRKFLNEVGVDDTILSDKTKTESGANVLGGAKPAKSYKSLGLAEDAFKDYLGLHNKIESITDDNYELAHIMIVNNGDFMQAVYNTDESLTGRGVKTITVKLTKTLPVNELTDVYFEDGNTIYNEEDEMFGVKYKIYKGDKKSDLYNLAWFSTNGKSYSIETKAGLTKENLESLLDELIWNVITMEDWEAREVES